MSWHFTGIKGVGMTALALCALDLGKKISGSDTDEVFPTDAVLKRRQIKIKIGFDPKHLASDCDLVIYTGAHAGSNNPEVLAAKKRGLPVLPHARALAQLTTNKKTIAVAGVGGKSTTAALLATVLDAANVPVSFSIGVGDIFCLQTPGRFDKTSRYFVVEADEYVTDPGVDPTPRFHYLQPQLAVITNLEYDHPDVYPDLQAIFKSFARFIEPVPQDGLVVVNWDNPHCRQWSQNVTKPVASFGFSPQADWQIINHHTSKKKQFFHLRFQGVDWPEMVLNLPGRYNLLNAAATVAVGHHLGLSAQQLKAGLRSFTGTKRRFELIASVNDIELYDDYAHHPTEIAAVLKAAQDWLPGKRIVAIFQSHTYSRTKALLNDFAKSFSDADAVLINDIFASARETDNLGLTGQRFSEEVKKYHPHVFYCPDETATSAWLKTNAKPGDAIFTLGAGNNWLWHQAIIKTLKNL